MQFDIIFIGGGPGGYVGAIKAASLGLKVALIEQEAVGGTCLMRGCIPTKTLIAAADRLRCVETARDFGITIEGVKIDFGAMKARKDRVVNQLWQGVTGLVKAHGVHLFSGTASFISPHEIKVRGKDNIILESKKIVIATGSTPMSIPSAPVDQYRIHDSTSILELTKLPKTLAILGAGYIGCEFASLFAALGVKVTMVEFLPGIVWTQGTAISQFLTKAFAKADIKLLCNTKMESCKTHDKGVTLTLSDGSTLDAEMLLVSVGRKPNTEGLELGRAGINTTAQGFIPVNDKMETDVVGIYAIGDVTGKSMLAHSASHQGVVAAMNAAGKKTKMHYHAIPAVIFTHPEIATVGMTVEQAKEAGFIAEAARFPFSALGKALASGDTEGYAELVFEKSTGRILGAFIVGHEAGNMIAEMTLAIHNELTLACLEETIHAHPTLAESLMEAAHLALGHPIHLPPLKKKH